MIPPSCRVTIVFQAYWRWTGLPRKVRAVNVFLTCNSSSSGFIRLPPYNVLREDMTAPRYVWWGVIAYKRERAARGIWKSPEQREKVVN